MARTQVQSELIATNAISGTIIADNAITATHIATNSISGTLVQDGGIVTTMIAANNVTAAKIVSDGVETRHLHSNVISGQSTVTAASGDYVLIGDTSDSNNLKKALVSDFGNDLDAAVTINESGASVDFRVESNTNANMLFVDGSADKVGIGTSSPSTLLHLGGTAPGDSIIRQDSTSSGTNWEIGERAAGKWQIFEDDGDSIVATFKSTGDVGIGEESPAARLHVEHSSSTAYNGAAEITESLIVSNKNGTDNSGVNNVASIGLHVADGATSQGFINYVRTGNNTGNFTFTQRTASTTYSESMRIHSSGHVSIGGTANASGDSLSNLTVGGGSGDSGISIYSGTSSVSRFMFADGTSGSAQYNGFIDFTHSDSSLGMGIDGGRDLTIDSSGRVLIGWTSSVASTAQLQVNSNAKIGNFFLQGDSSNSYLQAGNGGFKVSTLEIIGGGTGLDFDVSVVVTGAGISTEFRVDSPTGDTYTNDGSVSSLSDRRIKTDINNLADGLDIVKQLRPVTFKYSDTTEDEEGKKEMGHASDKVRYGFIAQEVEEVAPHYVETSTRKINNEEVDDFKSMSTTRMIPMLVKAIQELEAEVEKLKG